MSKVEISVVVDSEIRYIREDWLPREDAEISSITSCELPINGLCLWSSRFHGHEVILPYATIVWNMEEFLLAAIHHGEAGAGHDSSEHVPQRYNDLRTAIADWRMKLQSNNGIEHLFEKEKCKLINTENLQLTILLRDLDKELLNFQRRRAIRALEVPVTFEFCVWHYIIFNVFLMLHRLQTGSPPLSVLVDSAISFLAYEAGIHVAQIRSTSILDYLSCVAKNLKDMHTQLRTDDDFNFALKSRYHLTCFAYQIIDGFY